MPKMIPNVSIGVSRKVGSRNMTIFPAIGEMFDFTDEEIKQVKAEYPNGLRRPINEMETASTEEPEEVTSEEEGVEETSQTQHTARLTPQQQRQRDMQAQREARRTGRRPHSEDEL
jgi:hypothetical protein